MRLRETEDIYKTVKDTFFGDNPYLQKFHVESPCGLMEATKYTVRNIFVYVPNQSVFYEITTDGNEPIGYACIFENEIWDFGIRKEFRDRKNEAWDTITKGMNGYSVRLYQDNERDFDWLVKERGCKPVCHYLSSSEVLIKFTPNGTSDPK